MNRNELEAAAEERLFDALLDEVVGRGATAPNTLRGNSRWLAAAVVLFGVAVVAGVVAISRAPSNLAVQPQEPAPLPPPVHVRGLAALQKLDRATTTNLCVQSLDGSELAALEGFPQLRALAIESAEESGAGDRPVTVWMLTMLVQCPQLERVSLGALGKGQRFDYAGLTKLPKLRSLVLAGSDKVVDAQLSGLLGKLPLRELTLQRAQVLPGGLQLIGELPLLERLELHDCPGLESCDLQHLYRLRRLRSLSLQGVSNPESRIVAVPGEPISMQLPEVRDGKLVSCLTGPWMQGLTMALPELSELDVSGSVVDAALLAALPPGLTFLGVRDTLGLSGAGVATICGLPELRTFACSDPRTRLGKWGFAIYSDFSSDCLPVLQKKLLRRIDFTGLLTDELIAALRTQAELRELRLQPLRQHKFSLGIRVDSAAPKDLREVPLPNLTALAELPQLEKVELQHPQPELEAALRKVLPARVRIEIVER